MARLLLALAGVDPRTVQQLMGRKTLTMTLRYAHRSPAHELAAVQRLVRPTGTATGTSDASNAAIEPPH